MSDAIKTVWLDSPPVNALGAALVEQLDTELSQIPVETRVVVLRGRGKAFSAGADISELRDGRLPPIQDVAQTIESVPVPVVAAIHGFCLGGGLELALACDLRIAQTGSKLGLPEVHLGLLPGGGGTQRLPRLIGPGRANWLMLSGGQLDAEKAFTLGLVEDVVDDLEAGIEKVAGAIAQQSRNALIELKRLLVSTRGQADYALELEAFTRTLESADGKEGIAAFLEKRAPVWGAGP